MDYPHYVQPFSALKDHHFVGSYMPQAEIDKLKTLFPNGCNGDSINEYIVVNGRELIDSLYDNTKSGSPQREKAFYGIKTILDDNKFLLWDLREFFYKGYWIIFDDKLTLAVCKGKIKPNKHTEIVLLDKVPVKIMKTWKEVVKKVINPMIELADSL